MNKKIAISILIISFAFGAYRGFFSQPHHSNVQWPPYEFTAEEVQLKSRFLTEHHYRGTENTRNYYARIENPANPIPNPLILVTGLEDIPENWWETAQRALHKGFQTIYIVEIRGQGRSERVPGNKDQAAHVNRFENYVNDLLFFLQHLKAQGQTPQEPPFVIAHSTGSVIYMKAFKRIKQDYPAFTPKKISLWGPFIKSTTSPVLDNPYAIALLDQVEKVLRSMGWMMIVRDFSSHAFVGNTLTGDQKKYERSESIRVNDGLISQGVSLRWAIEVFRAAGELLKNHYESVDRPTLLIRAGHDQVVSNEWSIQNPFFQFHTIPEAEHALHIERQPIFDETFRLTFDFFLNN
jgi:alpha-beta hydrolase superfamily lysophospholipase